MGRMQQLSVSLREDQIEWLDNHDDKSNSELIRDGIDALREQKS